MNTKINKMRSHQSKNSKTRSRQPRRMFRSQQNKLQHLLNRASFGATVAEIKELQPFALTEIVEKLLFEDDLPEPPGDWVAEPFDRQAFRALSKDQQKAWRQQNRKRVKELRGWWLQRMMSSVLNLREKMTFYWHGHFTSNEKSVQLAQYLYIQNHTLRRHALGNFGHFLKAIYKDPAMLLYLNGVQNKSKQPNENFARELLELFTMGIGNYTENDIKEAARAFTGWQIDSKTLTSFLNPRRFDSGRKTFLGRSGNWNSDDIIDIVLQQPQTAVHICRKLYKFFISRELDEDFVAELAETFRSQEYEIKPVLRKLFNSAHFYSDKALAALIKSPVEMAVSNARLFAVEKLDLNYVLNATKALNQELFNPPNVAGWPGQRSWISPTTYVTRNTFTESYLHGGLYKNPDSRRTPIKFNAMKFGSEFGISRAPELAQAMVSHLLRMPIDNETFEFLLSVLVGSADPDDWSLHYPGAERQVTEFLIQLIRLPEFQLN